VEGKYAYFYSCGSQAECGGVTGHRYPHMWVILLAALPIIFLFFFNRIMARQMKKVVY
jgi:hypothetical protein